MNLLKVLLCALFTLKGVQSFLDPASLTIGASVIAGISYFLKDNKQEVSKTAYTYVAKVFNKVCQRIGYCEGCEDYWIPGDLRALEYELRSEVFGQPLAIEMIMDVLRGHLYDQNPRRSLVLSFQGSAGTGKNFVSKIILKNMFRRGKDTNYVKFYRGQIDFPLEGHVAQYKKMLAQDIKERVLECHRSVFVFDEVEKMPSGILDVIRTLVNTEVDGDYDFRRVIFIIISNIGGESLNREYLMNHRAGIEREYMNKRKLTRLLSTEAYNSEGGLKHTGLVKNSDISFFVPFLPLETHHIIQCLEHHVVSVKRQIMSPKLTQSVIDEMIFYPADNPLLSSSGCKRVAEIANTLIEREIRIKRRNQFG